MANSHDEGNWANIFKPEFSFENQLKSFQDNILDWCQNELKNINNDGSFTTIKSRSAKAAGEDVLTIPQQIVPAENLHNFEVTNKNLISRL